MTSSKLSAELTSIVRDKLELGPEEFVNIRVFIEEDAILEKLAIELERKGFKIKNIQEGPDIVITGTLPVQKTPAVNNVSEMNKVKYDRSVQS